MKKCEACKGVGIPDVPGNEGKPCKDCGGFGETVTPGYVYCQMCDEHGKMWVPCDPCKGTGRGSLGEESVCPKCEGIGEYEAGICIVCDGAREIPKALAELREADKNVRLHSPDWDGVIKSEQDGITMYSLSSYFRNRKTVQAQCAEIVATRHPVSGAYYVEFNDDKHAVILCLNGLSWGYGGEGPHGFATILNDLMPSYWTTDDAAIRYVARQKDTQFTLTRPRLPQRKPEEL